MYVWTERGTARHAKMLNTKVAWEVHEKLEAVYFRVKDAVIAAKFAPVSASLSDLAAMQAQINELKLTVNALKSNVEELTSTFEAVAYAFEEGLTEMKKRMPPADCADKLLTIAGMMHDYPERNAMKNIKLDKMN